MKKLLFILFTVLSFAFTDDVLAMNVSDKITDKILFTDVNTSGLNSGMVILPGYTGENVTEYLKNGIKFYAMTKEEFIKQVTEEKYNLIMLENGQFIIGTDNLVHFDEDVEYDGLTYNGYQFLFETQEGTGCFPVSNKKSYYYSSPALMDGYLVFYPLKSFDNCEHKSFVKYKDLGTRYNEWLSFLKPTAASSITFSNISDLSDIYTLYDLYDVNNELLKKGDIYFSDKSNPEEDMNIGAPNEVCFTDEGATVCSTSSTTAVGTSNYFTSSVINDLYYLGSTDVLPKSIDFKWNKFSYNFTGATTIFKFNLASWLSGVTTVPDVPDVRFRASMIVDGKSFYCNDNGGYGSSEFTCRITTSYQGSKSVILHLDYDLIPENQIYSVGLAEKVSYTVIKDAIAPPDPTPTPEEETAKTTKNIFQQLIELPGKIINGITSALSSIVSLIGDLLKSLFIPSDDYLQGWFTDVQGSIETQLGFLAYPFTWILEVLGKFLTLSDTGSYVISWSALKVPNFEDFTLISAGSYDLASLLSNKTIKAFHDMYLIILDALMVLAFMSLCMNTYNKVFGGDQDNYEYISVDEGYTADPETGEVTSMWGRSRKTTRKKV